MMTELKKKILDRLDSHHRENINDFNFNIPWDELLALDALDDYTPQLNKYIEEIKTDISNLPALKHTECKEDTAIRFDVCIKILDKLKIEFIKYAELSNSNRSMDILNEFIDQMAEHVTNIATELNKLKNIYDYCIKCQLYGMIKVGTYHKIN